jgi:ESS family glutamate:Na+ symporter
VADEVRTGIVRPPKKRTIAGTLSTATEAIDSAAINLALVAAVYLCAYFAVRGLVAGLAALGVGPRIAESFWGFTFVFAAVLAMLARKIFRRTGAAVVIDDGLMSRIAGVSVDYMVVSALSAISFAVLRRYVVPFSIVALLGGIATTVIVVWSGRRAFRDHHFARTIGMYGALTGTIPTGLALVRIVDPGFSTTVAEDLVYGTGIALALGFPLIVLMGLPGMDYGTGSMTYTWWTLAAIFAYLGAVLLVSWLTGILKLGTVTDFSLRKR